MKAKLIDFQDIPSILPSKPVISIAGAGGKTTLMFTLAEMLPGFSVATTTTKVGAEQIKTADQRFCIADFPPETPEKTMWVSRSLEPENGKIIGCNEEEFRLLCAICRENNWNLIAETDGAATRHIKAPASHEPVIPSDCNICFYLVGLDVLNQPIDETAVHRPEIFSRLTGSKKNDLILPADIIKLLDHPEGGLKGIPDHAVRIAYLTHAAAEDRILAGHFISENLQQYNYVCIN